MSRVHEMIITVDKVHTEKFPTTFTTTAETMTSWKVDPVTTAKDEETTESKMSSATSPTTHKSATMTAVVFVVVGVLFTL